MPRAARTAAGGLVYHVLNRGNNRQAIFLKPQDYAAFIKIMSEGRQHAQVELFAYCLMPNHWHLVLRPVGDRDLAAYLGWVSNTHVKRYRQHYHDNGIGHLYQGRYKSFPIQEDRHLLTVLRYVEGNALRAGMVDRAEHWRWSSVGGSAIDEARGLLSAWPVERPADWLELVNQIPEQELTRVRQSVTRGRPFGAEQWVVATAAAFGLEQALRPRGRPRKSRVGVSEGAA